MRTIPYKPIPGWFDLSKLDLPRKTYARLAVEALQDRLKAKKKETPSD